VAYFKASCNFPRQAEDLTWNVNLQSVGDLFRHSKDCVKATTSVVMSVRQSVRTEQLCSHCTNFREI
jgi:hypothetical protein